MSTLFISDLHLHESRPLVTRAFFHFLDTRASKANTLYILGDFFDAWIGDDDDSSLPQEVAQKLFALRQKGVAIYFMHGNRDFLLGKSYAQQAGMELLPEACVIDLYGTPSLLLHGDTLCTADVEYQHFRQTVRHPQWQQQILAQPLAARRLLAAQLREKSQSMNSMKAEDIMDVTQEEVIRQMQQAKVTRLIHGHTHRPATHRFQLDGQQAERIVLGDWHSHGWCVEADEQACTLISWPIE